MIEYNIGDKVKVKENLEIKQYDMESVVDDMLQYAGKEAIITDKHSSTIIRYKINIDKRPWNWTWDMFESEPEKPEDQFENWEDVDEIKKYGEFIMEKYKLIISNEPAQSFSTDTDWILTLDVKDLWNKYDSKKINTVTFVNEYKKYLISKQQEILGKTGEEGWKELNDKLEKFTDYDKESVLSKLDDIYDWGDKYAVKIEAS